MWGTFLSEPLGIVALVGRYPANKLMSRMPIRLRSRLLWPKEDASPRPHAVLGRISPGYPAETGRLHTRYSPVRRSPAEQSKLRSPMPLDLHVLGLSLAFILSQDQTLRCMYVVFVFFYCFHDRCAVCEPKNRRPEVSCPDRLLRLAQKLTKRLSCHAAVVAAADPFSCTTCLL